MAQPLPAARDIVEAYSKSLAWLDNCSITADVQYTSSSNGAILFVVRQRSEYYCRDGKASLQFTQRSATPPSMPPALPPATQGSLDAFDMYIRTVSTADGYMSYWHFPGDKDSNVTIYYLSGRERVALAQLDVSAAVLRGWYASPYTKRFDDLLKGAPNLSIEHSTEPGDADNCFLIRFADISGDYSAWIDMSRGGNLIRLKVERGPLSEPGGKPLYQILGGSKRTGDAADMKVNETIVYDDIALKRQQGVWLPTGIHSVSTNQNRLGKVTIDDVSVNATEIILNPDPSPERLAFNPPEGVEVFERRGSDIDGIPRIWHQGKATPVVNKPAVTRLDESLDRVETPSAPQVEPGWSGIHWLAAFLVLIVVVLGIYWLASRMKRPVK